ncbi:MAG: Ig-like domain-containing protein [Clostridia bacterium]|nr:Ig-like domain-containing protein [Clostridia bacterium]
MKKMIAMIVSMLLVFSCLPAMFVFAAGAPARGSYIDDFEDGALSAPFTNWGDYAVAEGVGKGGSKGLVGHRSYAYVEFENAMTTDDIAVITYDFKISALPTDVEADTTFLTLGQWPHNGSVGIQAKYYVSTGKADFVNGANTVAVDTSAWYRMIIFKESSAPGSGQQFLLDDSGALLLSKTNLWMDPISSGYDRFTPFNMSDVGAEIVVDNLALDYFDKSTATPTLQSSSITSGATNVLRNQTFRFTFNQALHSDSVIAVTGGNTNPVVVSKPVANYIDVSFTSLLERNTTYTVSFAGVKNASGTACSDASISFTTEDVHVLSAPVVGDVTPVTDVTTKVAFTLSDPYNYPKFTGIVAAAVYDVNNSLLGFDLLPVADVAMGTETELTFGFGLTDAKIVKIMAFDYANGLMPLAVGEKALS